MDLPMSAIERLEVRLRADSPADDALAARHASHDRHAMPCGACRGGWLRLRSVTHVLTPGAPSAPNASDHDQVTLHLVCDQCGRELAMPLGGREETSQPC